MQETVILGSCRTILIQVYILVRIYIQSSFYFLLLIFETYINLERYKETIKIISNNFEHMVNLVDLYPSTYHPYGHQFLPSLDSMKVQLIFTLISLTLGFCILLPVTSDFSGNHAGFTFKVYLESHYFVIPHKKITFFLSYQDFSLHYCNSFQKGPFISILASLSSILNKAINFFLM